MKQTLSIEDGFQVVMLFAQMFWYHSLKARAVKLLSADIIKDNDFFFLCVCDGTSYDYFEIVIEKKLGISKKEQHQGLKVSEEVLFQLTIDLCHFFNQRFLDKGKDSLHLHLNN